MKNATLALLLVIAITGCEKDKTEINGTIINLLAADDPTIFKKSVILFDNNKFNIKTPLDTFLIGYPFAVLYGYDEMKTRAISDSTIFDVLNVKDYMKYNNDSIYTLAFHLENGSCLLLDKGRNTKITSIVMERYFTGEPMASKVGRRFYIENILFLETVDMISK